MSTPSVLEAVAENLMLFRGVKEALGRDNLSDAERTYLGEQQQAALENMAQSAERLLLRLNEERVVGIGLCAAVGLYVKETLEAEVVPA